jgi:hypothetical protein
MRLLFQYSVLCFESAIYLALLFTIYLNLSYDIIIFSKVDRFTETLEMCIVFNGSLYRNKYIFREEKTILNIRHDETIKQPLISKQEVDRPITSNNWLTF